LFVGCGALCRPGKTVWDRKWVVLRDNKVFVFSSHEDATTCPASDEFDLCPHDGVVSVRSAVTHAELTNVSSSDLVYVLMLEFEPDSALLSNRCALYLYSLC